MNTPLHPEQLRALEALNPKLKSEGLSAMTGSPRAIAERVADRLLLNAFGERGFRLDIRLETEPGKEVSLGGWRRGAIVDEVEAALEENAPVMARKTATSCSASSEPHPSITMKEKLPFTPPFRVISEFSCGTDAHIIDSGGNVIVASSEWASRPDLKHKPAMDIICGLMNDKFPTESQP